MTTPWIELSAALISLITAIYVGHQGTNFVAWWRSKITVHIISLDPFSQTTSKYWRLEVVAGRKPIRNRSLTVFPAQENTRFTLIGRASSSDGACDFDVSINGGRIDLHINFLGGARKVRFNAILNASSSIEVDGNLLKKKKFFVVYENPMELWDLEYQKAVLTSQVRLVSVLMLAAISIGTILLRLTWLAASDRLIAFFS